MKQQIKLGEENCGILKVGTKVCADNGYYSENNIHYLSDKKLDPYIPEQKEIAKSKTEKKLKMIDSTLVTLNMMKKMMSLYVLKIKDKVFV